MSAASEQLKEKGAEVLTKMIDITVQSMNDVIEFGKQQIPEVIHQLLMWRATNSAVWLSLGFIILVLSWKWFKQVNKWASESGDDEHYALHILTAIFTFVGVGFIMPNLLEILQIMVAPKVYLIEYASELIKK